MKNKEEPRTRIGSISVYCAFDEIVSIKSMVPHPQNPNKHPEAQIKLLARIIQEQGWRAPITVSTRSGYIVRGHGRLMAAQSLGTGHVLVEYQNYDSEESEKADMIADNKISEFSELDDDIIAELLKEIYDNDMMVELTGFDLAEFDRLIGEEDSPTTETPQEAPYEPQTFAPPPPSPVNPMDYYDTGTVNADHQRQQSQTGEINLNDYAEDRYKNQCPKCKFKW